MANESGVLAKRKINEIVQQVSPGERVDPEVEEVLLEIAEDFVDNVTNWACQLAKHRKSQTLETQVELLSDMLYVAPSRLYGNSPDFG